MKGISDTVNWYGRTYPALDKNGQDAVLSCPDPEKALVRHAVYHVIKGLVLRGKTVTAGNISSIIDGMYAAIGTWMSSDRSMLSREFLLENASENYRKIVADNLLVNSRMFVSFDAPIQGGKCKIRSRGSERTYGETISNTYAGRAGTSLSKGMIAFAGAHSGINIEDFVKGELAYDPELDAYVRSDLVADREKHIIISREEVETGIFSFASEALRREESRIERHSPIRSSKVCDRLVKISKARLRKCRKTFRGTFWKAPGIGESASVLPQKKFEQSSDRTFDFKINKRISLRLQEKCLGCMFIEGCSSWGRNYFSFGIHGPTACNGPILKGDI